MRRLSLLAAVAVVFTLGSCSNDRELDNTQTKGSEKEINFRSFIEKGAESRTTMTNTGNILGFTVTGWWNKTGTTVSDIGTPTEGGYLFNAFDITRREAGVTDWSYDPKLYWPSTGNGVYFFAYSPASTKCITAGKGLNKYKYAQLLEYTVPDPGDSESQEDFLLARTEKLNKGVVGLNFAHALSRVTFSAKNTNASITYLVKSVELLNINKVGNIDLKDIPTDGDFTSLYSPTGPTVTLWTSSATANKNLGVDLGDSPIYVRSDDYQSILGKTNALMVMPQVTTIGDPKNPASGFLVKVLYKAYIDVNDPGSYYAGSKGDGDATYKTVYFKVLDKARTAASSIDTPHTFEIGRQYNFSLTFGSEVGDAIKFDVDVSSWSDAVDIPLPQINYWYDGLISKELAERANPNYVNEGVTLNQIEDLTKINIGSTSQRITSNDAFKGLELFKNLKEVIVFLGANDLDITIPNTMALTKMEIDAMWIKNSTINKIDVSSQSNMLTDIKYQTKDDNGFGVLTVNEFNLWSSFNDSDRKYFDYLFFTGHSGGNTQKSPQFSIKKILKDGVPSTLTPPSTPLNGGGALRPSKP